jgi:hypothetical protein
MAVEDGGVRPLVLALMAAMFGVALAVAGAFGDDTVLFGTAYRLFDEDALSDPSVAPGVLGSARRAV